MKIVLSGIGLLSPAGDNYHSFIESIYAGTSFVSMESELSQYGTCCEVSSRIQNFKLSSKWEKYQSSTPLSLQYALNSALHAYEDAQLERSAASYTRGISFSTTMTNLWPSFDDNTPNTELHTPAILLARELGFLGPTTCQSIGSSAGIDALGLAIKTIQRGECDMMLVGATSQALCPLTFSAYDKMGCLSRAEGEPSTRSRPFDLTRKGFVFSEGSAFLVIETLESALKRNAPIYAEILSYDLNNESKRDLKSHFSKEIYQYYVNEKSREGDAVKTFISHSRMSANRKMHPIEFIPEMHEYIMELFLSGNSLVYSWSEMSMNDFLRLVRPTDPRHTLDTYLSAGIYLKKRMIFKNG